MYFISQDDDFEVQRERMTHRLNTSIGGLDALHQFAAVNNNNNHRRKRGPEAKFITNIWYCLPAGETTLPNFKMANTCPTYLAQKEAGYGKNDSFDV